MYSKKKRIMYSINIKTDRQLQSKMKEKNINDNNDRKTIGHWPVRCI